MRALPVPHSPHSVNSASGWPLPRLAMAGEKNGGGPPPSTKDEDASLIDDETQELVDQGITGMAVIGYRQAPARKSEKSSSSGDR